ncbi:MAG: VOC family protein [Pirellulales bacterium]|nr:VOC family protein [Pirellulales bacterium]
MDVKNYLNFDGRTEEALEFYQTAIGAKVDTLMRFSEIPEPSTPGCIPAGCENKVMHASFKVGETTLMASDCHCTGKPTFQGISLALSPANEAEADKLFNALSSGGQVQMPLAKTFFSPRFGVVVDRFGISWMVVVPHPNMK